MLWERGVATVTASVPPANWDHRLYLSKLIWLQCLKKLLFSDWIHVVTKISPMLTKHVKSSALMGMLCNTYSICGTRSLSWVSVACWSQGLSQLTGLHLVPEAMPRERKTWKETEPKKRHSNESRREIEKKWANNRGRKSPIFFFLSFRFTFLCCLPSDVRSNCFERFMEQG